MAKSNRPIRRPIRTDAFAIELCNELNRLQNKSESANKWTRSSAGLTTSRDRADVSLNSPSGNTVLIEVELRRGNPVANVVKTWFEAAKRKRKENRRLILVQAFSSYYKARPRWIPFAEFIGAQMQQQCGVKYLPIEFKYKPKKNARGIGGQGRLRARELAKEILNALRNKKR